MGKKKKEESVQWIKIPSAVKSRDRYGNKALAVRRGSETSEEMDYPDFFEMFLLPHLPKKNKVQTDICRSLIKKLSMCSEGDVIPVKDSEQEAGAAASEQAAQNMPGQMQLMLIDHISVFADATSEEPADESADDIESDKDEDPLEEEGSSGSEKTSAE